MIIIQYQENDCGLPICLIIHYDKGLLHDWIPHGHQLLGSSDMSSYIYIYLHMIKIQYQDNDVGLPIFLIIHYDKDLLHDLISHGHQLLGSSGWIFPSKAISDRNLVDQSIESLEI